MPLQWSDFKDEYFLPGELAIAERIPFRCPVCFHSVGEAPVSSMCGHTVCSDCAMTAYPDFILNPHPDICFVCRGKDPHWAPAYNVKFQVKALKIQCPRAPDCKWTGTYSDFLEHCNTKCEQRTYECKRFRCGQTVKLQEKESHDKWCLTEREVKCDDCGESMICTELLDVHPDECKRAQVPCPHCDDGPFLRIELEQHRKEECGETVVGCAKCGTPTLKRKDTSRHKAVCKGEDQLCLCGQSVPRKDMAAHMASAEFALQHLAASQATVANLEATAARLAKEKREMEKLVGQLKSETKKKRRRETKETEEEEGSSRDDSNVELLKTADLGLLVVVITTALITSPFVAFAMARYITFWMTG